MNVSDRDYYTGRMHEELLKASTCEDDCAAKTHLELAALYKRRLAELEEASG